MPQREISRVLKPDGILALTWNQGIFSPESMASMDGALSSVRRGITSRTGVWREMFDSPAYAELFQTQEEHTLEFSVPTSKECKVHVLVNTTWGIADDIVAPSASAHLLSTVSFIAMLPDEKKSETIKKVLEALDKLEGRKWIDREKGIWDQPCSNLMVIIRKK